MVYFYLVSLKMGDEARGKSRINDKKRGETNGLRKVNILKSNNKALSV